MTLTARRAHWRIGQAQAGPDETTAPATDPHAQRWACFTFSEHAAEWLTDQLTEKPVSFFGTIAEAVDAFDYVRRQGTRDEEADAEQRHASEGFAAVLFEIGGIEFRMEVCTCTGEVIGRCHNEGCDRDAGYDSEPGGDWPGYTRWSNHCYRCWYPEHAQGGYTSQNKPVPAHRHEATAKVARLIEDDEWTGWRCIGDDREHTTACGQVWRFADAEAWRSQFRLTRKWNGEVTGTEGYFRGTEADAAAQAQRLTDQAEVRGSGYTVGWEPVDHNKEDRK